MPLLLRPGYRSPKGHRRRKQLVGRLGCAFAMLQDSTDFPCSHGIREFQIFEPKPVHFKPVRLKGGYRGPPCIPRRQPCIPRGADPLRRFGHGSLLLAKYRNALPWLTRTKPQLQCTMIGAVEIDVAQILIE
jgi:hypothetical protein